MALVATSLSYRYAVNTPYAVSALSGVSLSLDRGELLLIAGTTGSGKSTLLRLLAGLLEPTAGGVDIDGVSPASRSARGQVALVFQNPESQFFAETLLADVAFGPRNLGADDPVAAATRALGAVGLPAEQFGERSPFTLSGGEARRAAIAGALAMNAPYLLLDEPTAGLDANGRREVIAAIEAERARAGVAVVTHDPDEFLARATRVLALSAGTVAFAGRVESLLAHPETYEACGLRLPEVVRVQMLARARGMALDAIELDPLRAARGLLAAHGATS